MSEIHVHIERLIVDGGDLSSRDAAAVHDALAAAVTRELQGTLGASRTADPRPSAHERLRAPEFAATPDRAAFGDRAGVALASSLAPLCGAAAAGRSTRRG